MALEEADRTPARRDEARRRFERVLQLAPDHPRAADARRGLAELARRAAPAPAAPAAPAASPAPAAPPAAAP
jgi:hypothetical protein